jgi:8-oxo-dGTP diphosphatase
MVHQGVSGPAHRGGDHAGRLYLVRHARAHPKKTWTLPDDVRPLTTLGHEQALRLVGELAACPVSRIVTSPTTRCRQTVEPLAAARGLPVEDAPALAVGTSLEELRRLAAEPGMDHAVWCTHGEVLRGLLDWLVPPGDGRDRLRAEKASVWLLEDFAGSPRLGPYIPPPPA